MTRNFALNISWLPVAAVGFTLVWLLGLAIPVPMVDVDASPAALAGHESEVALRSLFVHGFAAAALLAVGWGLSRPLAIAAAALSLMQWAMETAFAAGGPDALIEATNRVDGVKMLVLAALVLAGARLAPRWLRLLAPVTAVALVVSAAGYGLLVPPLAAAAFVSLPLLLIWITGSGLAR
ncbi:MAG TPA: hypothetical protein VFZ00_20265 [Solirubrobacter sp.]|nr:hypothetical protein [Solirubrobacter sp.]